MKKQIMMFAVAVGALGAAGMVAAQTSVSIGINQPGVYGRINIGDVPRPALVLPQPVLIAPPRVAYERAPIYLYVPPAHQRDWRRYCGRYSACGQPVYFVRDEWVRERYTQAHPGWDRGRGPHGDNGRHRGWDKHDDRGGDHGHGHGRGHDKHD